jgi:hypothetical protein
MPLPLAHGPAHSSTIVICVKRAFIPGVTVGDWPVGGSNPRMMKVTLTWSSCQTPRALLTDEARDL